jgi:hypothetical protein
MRKKVISVVPTDSVPGEPVGDPDWVNLEQLAQVEISSEEPAFPIESALRAGATTGWRAAEPGPQTIRLRFDRPQQLSRIRLVFADSEVPRTQEFVLRWSPDSGNSYQDIVRQQWNFSPPGAVREVEDYRVNVAGVTVLELQIVPDIGGGLAHASLAELRLA